MIDDPPEWLLDWSRQIGAELEDGLRGGPGFIVFARENESVYQIHGYGTRSVRCPVSLLIAQAYAQRRAV
jgi:hypothetical protein